MKLRFVALLLPSLAIAQQPVASLADQQARSQEVGSYAVANLFEAGYRFAEVGGDHDLYRAGVNYGNGIRLFSGRVRLTSLDRKGLLDEFSLRSTGALADPYQTHTVRAEKNRWFRYDLQYRLVRYHNRLPTLWRGEHGLASSRTLQTHEVTLRPGGRIEGILGFDRNQRSGPGFASEAIANRDGGFDARNFLRYRSDLEQSSNQYRAGLSARFAGLALTVIHAVDIYREAGRSDDASQLPSLAPNVQPVEAFSRSDPFHGRTPVTTVALRTRENRWLGLAARYVYSGGYRGSALLENLAVPDPAASASTYRDTFIVGDANRHQSSGDASVSLFASPGLAVTNTIAFHNTRIDGQAAFLETGLYRHEFLRFDHLGIRRLSNATEASFRPVKQVSVFGAYRFSVRRIRSREALRFPDFEFGRELVAQDNKIRSAAGGVRWLPAAGVRASFDFEVGRADRPLTPTSQRRFHNQSARVRWRRNDVSVGGFFRNRANDNPTELLAYSSQSRAQGLQASWVDPDSGTVLDASYSLLKMDVSSGILNLFDLGDLPDRGRSVYASSIHVLSLGLRVLPTKRLTLSTRYSLTKDTAGSGDGFLRSGADLVSGLPMTYQSPQARISIRLKGNLSWNLGWQYYGYAERFAGIRGYRSHNGFSSLSLSF